MYYYIQIYICMYVCMYIYIYVCMYSVFLDLGNRLRFRVEPSNLGKMPTSE